jgi:hypothetical protein
MTTLYSLFSHVQMIFLAGAGVALACTFYGFYKKADHFSHDVRSGWVSSTPGTGKDKRRAERVPCDLTIELLDKDRVIDIGRVVNLSSSGACFAGNLLLKHGQYISVRLPAMRSGQSNMTACVIWRQITRMSTLYGIRLHSSSR